MSNTQKRASVAITGDFTAQEVIALVSQIMVGNSYVYSKDESRRFHGKVVVELAEIVEPDEIPSAQEQYEALEMATPGEAKLAELPY